MLEVRPETNADLPGHAANILRTKKWNQSLEDVAPSPRAPESGQENLSPAGAALDESRDLRLKSELKIVQEVHIVGSGVLSAAVEVPSRASSVFLRNYL